MSVLGTTFALPVEVLQFGWEATQAAINIIRFSEDRGIGKVLNGVFLGISKDFQPRLVKGELTLCLEIDG